MFHKAYSKRDMTPDKNDFETYFLSLMRDLYSCGLSAMSLLRNFGTGNYFGVSRVRVNCNFMTGVV